MLAVSSSTTSIGERRRIAKHRSTSSSLSSLFSVLGLALLSLLSRSTAPFSSSSGVRVRAFAPTVRSRPLSASGGAIRHPCTSRTGDFTTAESAAIGDNDSEPFPIRFRKASAGDVPRCFEIESASYPSDEAATLESLIGRQESAGDYFLLITTTAASATTAAATPADDDERILGFACATRCREFTEESMSEHDPAGGFLAVHSVVIDEAHRRKGLATELVNRYVETVVEAEELRRRSGGGDDGGDDPLPPPIRSIVLIAKQHLLGFYVRCGFRVNRPSPIVHGKDLWYDLELEIPSSPTTTTTPSIRTKPLPGESWFCKTERFKPSLPFGAIKPHLDAHGRWVDDLRRSGETCIVSGYRVDSEGKPGGGGLMFLAAKSYEEAYELVSKNDPLIVNDCVDWELNGWIGQVGGITVD